MFTAIKRKIFHEQLQASHEARLRIEELARECDALKERNAQLERDQELSRYLLANLSRFGDSVLALRDSFSDLSQLLGSNRKSAEHAAQESEASRKALESIVHGLGSMNTGVRNSASEVASLRSETRNIDGFVGLIDEVAKRTNLISFNAGIEAARAGDAGSGFAVIAQEVRSLAGRTGEATREIGNLIGGVQRKTGEIDSLIQGNAAQAEELSADAGEVLQRTSRLLELSQNSNAALAFAAILSEIELANLEELEIKLSVYRIFMGISRATADEIPDETECRLGQWYYEGDGGFLFANVAGFKALEEPHREVHRQAREAVNFYHAGRHKPAMEALAEMERNNIDVMSRLRLMLQQSEARLVS